MTAETAPASLRCSPLAHRRHDLVAGSTDGSVALREDPFLAQVNLRVDPSGAAASRIATALDVGLPTEPGTVATLNRRSVLWLGPDEWLVVGPDGDGPSIEHVLRTALGADNGSIVVMSAGRTTLELSGPAARDVMEKCCSIDLHPRAFRPGRCAQTLVAHCRVIVWQTDEVSYRLLVHASYAEWLADWLLDAMTEFRAPAEGLP